MGRNGALAARDFRLLFAGRCASLLGDGAFLVALAWQAYTISGAPSALSLLGIAMTVPLIALLLFGGIVSDRHSRRRVMLFADLLRAVVLVLLGALVASGTARLWQMMMLVALCGAAQAFFDPASDAILPELLPAERLGEANALEQVARPLALRLAGPALGGVLIGTLGVDTAFFLDAATFLVSAGALWAMSVGRPTSQRFAHVDPPCEPQRPRLGIDPAESDTTAVEPDLAALGELREGFSYVRRHVWLWGTLACAGVAYLLFMGPSEVLLPYMVKHVLGGSGVQLGLVLGAGGVGAVGCALVMLRSGLPSRSMRFIYLVWTLATLSVAGYGAASAIWQLMLASLAFNLLETAGTIVWATFKQQHVPSGMLGRVSSLDWFISIGLLPISFALTAPLSALLGARATLIAAGSMGAVATLSGLALPGMRAVDRELAGQTTGLSLTASRRAATIS